MLNSLFQFLFGAKVPLMPVRYDLLREMLPAYQETGIPFLLKKSDGSFTPLVNADDMGLYVIVPKLMHYFNLSLDNALSLFYNGMSITGLIIGCVGLLFLFKKPAHRLVAITYLLLLTKVTTGSFDNYRAPAALAMAALPWALYLLRTIPTASAYLYLFLLGLGAGVANSIRSCAGVAPLLFAATLLVTYCVGLRAWRQLIFGILLLSSGLAIPTAYFKYQEHSFEAFVKTHVPEHAGISQFHGFWHPVLGGLGFLTNDYALSYKDSDIAKRVARRDSSWERESGPEYERIAKAEFLDIARTNPWFVLTTYAAKGGVLLLYLLLFANIGLIGWWLRPPAWQVGLAFLVALGWSALPGLLAIPITPYLYGFIVIAGMVGMVGINKLVR